MNIWRSLPAFPVSLALSHTFKPIAKPTPDAATCFYSSSMLASRNMMEFPVASCMTPET
jgi:hypothetical protein